MAQFFWASPRLVQTGPHHFLNRKPVNFPHQPFRRGLVAGSGIYFHSGDGPEMLPAAPGGLLAIEAVFIGMTSAEHVREEVAANLEVLLLLMFMVAGIYFMKQLLLFIFTRLLLSIRSKMLLSLSFAWRQRSSPRSSMP